MGQYDYHMNDSGVRVYTPDERIIDRNSCIMRRVENIVILKYLTNEKNETTID